MEERLIERSIAISPSVTKQRANLFYALSMSEKSQSAATNLPFLFSL